ncbi:MAG: 3-oxoacyl-[acyl-carrier-protein] reductase [Thermoflexales bacterium]|nr:3-oxoacyl-[acyl-carrier-protein] reductase [Thermoflexales bacterium]MCS7325224.1 3-oxoacyl-[acyl-carrier-protein] reductase [Thermoflexales bacterium]MCX7939955.1 3-oxoacyl-[acyl-carrier-protein] reductase [Thermoflexales bacterium]MDW8053349.1 3-oxoacyl-[acyl-carrier-protein] reductase [Anaerolineae bacterium]MDW8292002.1 3-oxoacyl-[acyl-carrier-protein] reductase [Anaerolineae bacterium]
MNLNNRVAVVTGAARGIGRAIAIELAQRGAAVVVNYNTSEAAAHEVVEHITSRGGRAIAHKADVSRPDEANALIKAALDAFGKLDILVNNAGITRDTLLMTMSEEDWDAVIGADLKSVFNCCKAAVRPMIRARYGRIVNISSVVGLVGQGGQTNYAAAKAGIIGFSKSLAKELGSRNITVNVVAPGFIPTALTDVLSEEQKQAVLKATPLGRFGTPEEVAYAVAFFASDEAAFITGAVLTVDGGLVMH